MATYQAQDFSHLLGATGFSDTLLKNHFSLYEGYVTNTNKLIELIPTLEPGMPQFSECKRRFGWEWNGMRLHEFYFGNMTKEQTELSSDSLKKKIEEVYGSFEKWKENFIGVGTMRGIGWVVLTHDPATGLLFNVWINEHDTNHLAGTQPLLIMDVFEHAFMIDYGTKRADYIDAFFNALDWRKVEKRFEEAQNGKVAQA